ncbi:SDR family NAD(P)-dependent oxidoreductase [Parahaliea aestuarii]|uniref:SDR family NAD(P)-dependent oxidoreductase n=1 Tax=Parahaliea aestuarii TaxID=1852021 RepID=A0A5C8ZVA5_9GAMM|nr:SDR family NAD(P)-dependent oxidoreductase [Parahaliea aestuarii]TXS91759.1 SDR family NAD(P)-dependent oxidoreductase [Parahaliea aestuarii]
MKVLITGATGLVGLFAAVQCLRDRHTVRVLVRDSDKFNRCLAPFDLTVEHFEIAQGDITDAASLTPAMAGCDALIHCAGIFSDRLQDAEKLQNINVDACRDVLNKAVALGMDPVVHVSSYLALFPPAGKVQTADDRVARPKAMYTRTKAAAEQIARDLQDAGKPVVTIYPGSVQGPHDPTFSIGSQLLAQAIRSGRYLVTEGGRSFTDVRDLAHLLSKLLQAGRGPRRIMCGGYYLSYEEQRALLEKVSGRSIKAQSIPGPLLRFMGSSADLISRLSGRQFALTREAAEVLTRSVPCDDQPGLIDPGYPLVGAEQSFRDLVDWMAEAGKLRRRTE